MPKLLKFVKNSSVYLKGDRAEYIYLVKEGEIVLVSSIDGVSSNKTIKKGDFFGLFSAIGKVPRQEDAFAYGNVEVLAFDNEEFEKVVANNSRLSLQLMTLMSKELREVHKKASELLYEDSSSTSLPDGLYSYIQMYLDNNEKAKAKYIILKFMEEYPSDPRAKKLQGELQKLG